jgi:hypothetical protein
VQSFTRPPDVGLRRPAAAPTPTPAPPPAPSAQRRAADVLPVGPVIEERGRRNWAVALVATVARTTWLAVILALVFVGSAFGATWADGRKLSTAVAWILMGGGIWLAVALLFSALRARR